MTTDGLTVWFTGLSGSGKTTLCRFVEADLLGRGMRTECLDGDEIRKRLCHGLGFSREDRIENIRRIGYVAQLLTRNGVIVLVAAISPYRAIRQEMRQTIGSFLEVYVNAPLSVCEARDPKGLYKKARDGQLQNFTGIDDPYEPPVAPNVVCHTDQESVRMSTERVVAAVTRRLYSKELASNIKFMSAEA